MAVLITHNGGTINWVGEKRVPEIGNEELLRPDPVHVKQD